LAENLPAVLILPWADAGLLRKWGGIWVADGAPHWASLLNSSAISGIESRLEINDLEERREMVERENCGENSARREGLFLQVKKLVGFGVEDRGG